MQEREGDDGDYREMTQHVDSFHGIPHDARMLGLDRHTQEGALISMAGSLNPAKLSHKVVAWLMLLAFIAPGLLGLFRNIF